MSLPKILTILSISLFVIIGIAALTHKKKDTTTSNSSTLAASTIPVEIDIENEVSVAPSLPASAQQNIPQEPNPTHSQPKQHNENVNTAVTSNSAETQATQEGTNSDATDAALPYADRLDELFSTEGKLLPIVETVTYKSRVSWQKGRPAWLSDYATHYNTSRHFIARSLNGTADYLKQDVANGDKFNVYKKGKNFNFHLLVDLSRAKLWLYYQDHDTNEKVLLKRYDVSLGRFDGSQTSGSLTPLGTYTLGNKIATYKQNVKGYHKGKQIEMIRVFGTRWIPFEKEVTGYTAPAKGLGIHGVPWLPNATGVLAEDTSSIGRYESDGCIRLSTANMEELFAIIVTKPTTVEIVKDFFATQQPAKNAQTADVK